MEELKPSLDIRPLPEAEEVEVICSSMTDLQISSSSNDDLEATTFSNTNNNEQQQTIEISNINTISHRTYIKKAALFTLISLALIGVIAGALTLSLNNNKKLCSSCNANNNNMQQSQQDEEWDVSIGLYDILAPDFNDDLKPAVDDSDFVAEDYYVVDNLGAESLQNKGCNDINCNSTSTLSAVSSEVLAQQLRISTISSQRACKANEGRVVQKIVTDNYGFETSYRIINLSNGQIVAQGPPTNTRYADKQTYLGVLCLSVGQYNLQMNDLQGDGMCCGFGPGVAEVKVNGKVVAKTGDEDFKVKLMPFRVTAAASPPPPIPPPPPPPTPTPPPPVPVFNTPVNQGKECSIVNPVNYNTKFNRGNYESMFAAGAPFPCYRTVKATIQTIKDIVSTYPNLAKRVQLTNFPTPEKKQALNVLVLTNKNFTPKNGKGKLLAISSIHAHELTPAETTARFAQYMVQNYGKDADVTWILDYNEIHLIIQANPDGRQWVEKNTDPSKLHRKNRNDYQCGVDSWRIGVDLNRNFPFKWNACDEIDRCSEGECTATLYRGPSKNSEQETKAIVNYAKSLFPNSNRKGNLQQSEAQMNTPFPLSNEGVFLDIHSFGNEVGWGWGYTKTPMPNEDQIGGLGRKMASFGNWGYWKGYLFDGGTIDTTYGWFGAASFFFELGTRFSQPCEDYPRIVNDALPALMYAAKVSRSPYITSLGPDILCTTISSTNKADGQYINVQIEASDDKRTNNQKDDVTFKTGRQNIRLIEVWINCHPYSEECQPTVKRSTPNAGRSATVSVQFKRPSGGGSGKKTMYIRARDSSGTFGPVTARYY